MWSGRTGFDAAVGGDGASACRVAARKTEGDTDEDMADRAHVEVRESKRGA